MKITPVNLGALADTFRNTTPHRQADAAGVTRYNRRAPNAVPAVDTYHLRRCLRAGLVEVDGAWLVLTPAGAAALRDAEGSP